MLTRPRVVPEATGVAPETPPTPVDATHVTHDAYASPCHETAHLVQLEQTATIAIRLAVAKALPEQPPPSIAEQHAFLDSVIPY